MAKGRQGGRRDELVAAGARVVARDGVAAATTRRIAEEAGVPLGLVHYWFAGKDELLEQVVLAFLGEVHEAVGAAGPEPEPGGADYVTGRMRAVFDAVRADDPGRQIAMYELTTWALRSPETRDIARRQYAAYRETAARLAGPWLEQHGAAAGAPPETVIRFLAALFDGLVLAWLADPEGADADGVLAFAGELLARIGQTPSA